MKRAPADLLGLGHRDLKGRRRIRLVMLAFSLVFLVIAGKLAFLSLMPRDERLPGGAEAQKMPRPDIVDRNGVVLATRHPSRLALCRAATRSSTSTRRSSCSPPMFPISTPGQLRRKLSLDRSFIWLKRQVIAERAAAHPRSRHSRHRLPQRDQARLSHGPACRPCARLCRCRFARPCRHREISRRPRRAVRRLACRPGQPQPRPRSAVDRYPRIQHALADELSKAVTKLPGASRRRRGARRQYRRGPRHGLVARLQSEPDRSKRSRRMPATA